MQFKAFLTFSKETHRDERPSGVLLSYRLEGGWEDAKSNARKAVAEQSLRDENLMSRPILEKKKRKIQNEKERVANKRQETRRGSLGGW